MTAVFRDHTVICGWNWRGRRLVEALQGLSCRPIVVVNHDVREIIAEIGELSDVFIIAGDCGSHAALMSADVPTARSVVVLADPSLGQSADARSVQIALAVEKIQVSVYTVVELTDVRSKAHFSWTKVDDLIADDELAVKLVAQGIYHVLQRQEATAAAGVLEERVFFDTLRRIVSPSCHGAQLFRIDYPWRSIKSETFADILKRGLDLGLLAVALSGYERHEIAPRPGQPAWISWKVEVKTNPPPRQSLEEIWCDWPGDNYPLGVFVLARTRKHAETLRCSAA